MKIIKNGSKERMLDIRYFECINCGCVFEANNTEYSVGYEDYEYTVEYYYCECPFCNTNTSRELTKTEIYKNILGKNSKGESFK